MKTLLYPIGCKALNDLIGGYSRKVITLFYGKTATAKTTLSAYLPIKQIWDSLDLEKKKTLPDSFKFVVIDGDGGFDVERAYQIWGKKADEIYSRLELKIPLEFSEQHKYITKHLPESIKHGEIEPLFICADPMTALYRGIVLRTIPRHKASTIGQYTGKLDLQMIVLRKLAIEFDIPVCISSWTVSPVAEALGSETEQDMIGGRQFGFIPKVIIELSSDEITNTVRTATLVKHRSRKSGVSAKFELCESGVKNAPG